MHPPGCPERGRRPGDRLLCVHALLVDDEVRLTENLSRLLQGAGFSTSVAHDGEEGLRLAARPQVDVVILDLLLPKMHGLDVLAGIRRTRPSLPVLALTALDSTQEMVHGLERGADDYLVKPFAFAELLARLRAVLRRVPPGSTGGPIEIEDLWVDPSSRSAQRAGRALPLSGREYLILEFLARRRGAIVSRQEIGEQVVDTGFVPQSNAIDVSICGLRAKLGAPPLIATIRGLGYRLGDPTR